MKPSTFTLFLLLQLSIPASLTAEEFTAQASNLRYEFKDLSGKQAVLKDGRFRGDHLKLDLLKSAEGDLNADGRKDGVAVLLQDSGGSGNFRQLCLLMRQVEKLKHLDTQFIGDRIRVNGLKIDEGIITVDFLDRAEDEGFAIPPTIQQRKRFRVQDGRLKPLP